MIYLDNAASTAIHPDVLDAMRPYFTQEYGNPSSIHRSGRVSRRAIFDAREQISKLIGSTHDEILFTSGGTESNNMVFNIVSRGKKRHVVTSSIEHESVLQPCKKLESIGFDVTYLPVDEYGIINTETIHDAIRDDTCLVSVMFANNEVGTVQNIRDIGKLCKRYNVSFHTDATQALGKIPIDVHDLCINLMSISSHKIHGPKGVGALYVQNDLEILPLILGGGQENGMRSGTENVSGIVGFGTACKIAMENMSKNIQAMMSMRNKLNDKIQGTLKHIEYNGHPTQRLPNNSHFTFLGLNGEDLIVKLDENHISASTGSACSLISQQESHVLKAMNLSYEQILGSLRLTVSSLNTLEEMEKASDILISTVNDLRRVSPYREKYGF